MNDKANGKNSSKKDKVVKFPSLAERDRIRKKQIDEENSWRKSYRKEKNSEQPFFNFGKIPPFTKAITILFVIIHVGITLFIDEAAQFKMINEWGFIPSNFTQAENWNLFNLLTPITYNFIHGDWTHLGFNVLMGLALGTFVEKMFSTPTTIKYYLLCGLGGALLFLILHPNGTAPVIGASGSISGLFAAALLMMYEQGRLGALTGKLANKGPWPLVFIWSLILIISGLLFGGIAWEAHLGGFLTGALLYRLMRTEKLRL